MKHKVRIRALTGPKQTGKEMIRLVRKYSQDLGPLAYLPLKTFYYYVAQLPYRKDPKQVEFVQRPKFGLYREMPFRDCDDKAILIASWAHRNGIPARFVAVGKNGRLHHVFAELWIKGRWVPMDATYQHQGPGIQKNYETRQLLGVI